MFYTSKKFCKITGITPETLRHYVDLGLLVPAEVNGNGYRKFSIENAVDMFYLRHERGLGAKLNQFQPENDAVNLNHQAERYQENLDSLIQQKELLQRQIDRNMYYQKLIYRAKNQLGEAKLLNVKQPFSLSFLEFSSLNLKNDSILKNVEEWMKHPELLHMAFRIDLKQVFSKQEVFKPRIGLGMRTDFVEFSGLSIDHAQTTIGSKRIMNIIARSESLSEIPRSALQPLLDELDEDMCAHHELIGRMITRIKEGNQFWYYFSCTAELKE